MPGADVEAVVALARIARGGAEVLEVPRRARRLVLVIPWRGFRDCLHATPRRVVRRRVLVEGRVLVLVVPQSEHRGIAGSDEEIGRRSLLALGRRPLAPVVRAAGRVARDVASRGDLRTRDRRAVVVENRPDSGAVCDGRAARAARAAPGTSRPAHPPLSPTTWTVEGARFVAPVEAQGRSGARGVVAGCDGRAVRRREAHVRGFLSASRTRKR